MGMVNNTKPGMVSRPNLTQDPTIEVKINNPVMPKIKAGSHTLAKNPNNTDITVVIPQTITNKDRGGDSQIKSQN